MILPINEDKCLRHEYFTPKNNETSVIKVIKFHNYEGQRYVQTSHKPYPGILVLVFRRNYNPASEITRLLYAN